MNTRFKFRNSTERYRHTPLGVLTNCYNKQKERCRKYKRPMPNYSLSEFQERYLHDSKFLALFYAWEKADIKKQKNQVSIG